MRLHFCSHTILSLERARDGSRKKGRKDYFSASTEQVTFLEQDLEIAKLKYENEGIYTCVARNSFNNGTYESWLSREVRVRGT